MDVNFILAMKRWFRAKTGLSPTWFEAGRAVFTLGQSLLDDITDYVYYGSSEHALNVTFELGIAFLVLLPIIEFLSWIVLLNKVIAKIEDQNSTIDEDPSLIKGDSKKENK